VNRAPDPCHSLRRCTAFRGGPVRNPAAGGLSKGRPVRNPAVRGLSMGVLVLAGLAGSRAATAAGTVEASAVRPGSHVGHAAVPVFRSVRTYQEVAVPVRLRIPSVGIDAPVEPVGQSADGAVAAPDGWRLAGWYDGGPRPGQQGPAVIVGHVDSRSGPAVFFLLPRTRPGDPIYVDRADGSTVRFRVTGRLQVAKSRFPADLEYAPTLQASLHLVTCAGSFDTSTGHYRDNVIVSAVPG
jgi:sortase (surface protein transpeptidase)